MVKLQPKCRWREVKVAEHSRSNFDLWGNKHTAVQEVSNNNRRSINQFYKRKFNKSKMIFSWERKEMFNAYWARTQRRVPYRFENYIKALYTSRRVWMKCATICKHKLRLLTQRTKFLKDLGLKLSGLTPFKTIKPFAYICSSITSVDCCIGNFWYKPLIWHGVGLNKYWWIECKQRWCQSGKYGSML